MSIRIATVKDTAHPPPVVTMVAKYKRLRPIEQAPPSARNLHARIFSFSKKQYSSGPIEQSARSLGPIASIRRKIRGQPYVKRINPAASRGPLSIRQKLVGIVRPRTC